MSLLRIAVMPNGPILVNASSGQVTGGFEAGLLRSLLQALGGPPHRLLVPDDRTWGVPDAQGRWSGVMGMLQRGQADLGLGSIFVSEARARLAPFSLPYAWQEVTFATRRPGLREKGAAAFAWPFGPGVWVALAVTAIVVALVTAAAGRRRVDEVALHVVGVMLKQPAAVAKVGWSPVLRSSWLWGSFFLSSGYMAVLLSHLSIPLREAPVESVAQLAAAVARGAFRVATPPGSSVLESLQRSGDPHARSLAAAILQEEWFIDMAEEQRLAAFLEEGNAAFISSRERIRFIFSDKFFLSSDPFFSVPLAIAVRRDLVALKAAVDSAVMRINQAGLYQKDVRDFVFRRSLELNTRRRSADSDHEIRQLALSDVSGAFVMLASGLAAAAVVAVTEMALGRKQVKAVYLQDVTT